MATRTATRIHHFHGGAKGNLVGTVVQPAPAWRPRYLAGSDPGGKILLSNLPPDVGEEEIIDLMKKTIGPVNLRDSFMIYNAKGFPRGMAIVAFVRSADAPRARERYNGKVIDGKRAIKLEIISDEVSNAPVNAPTAPKALKPKALFDRIGPASSSNQQRPQPVQHQRPSNPAGKGRPVVASTPFKTPMRTPNATSAPAPAFIASTGPPRKRQKKGPRRVKKSAAELDREMDEYSKTRTGGMGGEDAQMEGE
ncbi:hypothetical protein DFH11DRAFT_1544617 [Phellopilus nigrolimitatus]|nr:hypothetical protein DFH11DRAFT_1544617 [Phellopilus nigrolimitatus]